MKMRKNVCVAQRVGEIFGRHDQRIRIAVVGAQGCGKTIFLVSLINHLLKADLGDFGEWGVSTGVEFLSARAGQAIKPFDRSRYQEMYEALLGQKDGKPYDKGRTPPSTLQTYLLQLMVPLGRSKGNISKKKKVLLEVLDVPGERVADFAMFRRSYKEWSQEIIRVNRMTAGGRSAFDIYLSKAAQACSEDEIKNAFFEFVRDRYATNSPLIYPSTILLDSAGNKIDGLDRECHPFFNGDGFFAPLPDGFFSDKMKREIVKSFGRAYKQYRINSGLDEVCEWLETANKAYYLLDVFSILMGGRSREDDMKRHVCESLKIFGSRERNIFSRAYNGVVDSLMRSRAAEIYLVGTQVDRASKSQRNNVLELLKKEFNPVLRMPALAGKFCDVKTCAAIRFGLDEDEKIFMSYKLDPHEEMTYELKKFSNEVPTKFPEDYSYIERANDPLRLKYAYPYSQPRFGGDVDKVYAHIAFDEIVRTIFAAPSAKSGQ